MTKIRIIKGTTQASIPDDSVLYWIERWTGKRWEWTTSGPFNSKREADRVGELENPGNHRR